MTARPETPVPQPQAATQSPGAPDAPEPPPSGPEFVARPLAVPRTRRRHRAGRRAPGPARRRGRYVRARPWHPAATAADLAWDATLRAAASHGPGRARRLRVRKADLRRKERRARQAHLVLFVVDGSWSMAVARRMEATKGAVLALLTQAYQRRDWVGLITFRRDRAELVLPPTRSVMLARRALADLPVGGKTPLAAGLHLAQRVVARTRRAHPDLRPLVVLLTDGAGNVPLQPGHDPMDDAYQVAERLAAARVPAVVVNLEHPQFDQGLAAELARRLRAPVYRLPALQADALVRTVRRALAEGETAAARR